MWPYFKCTDRYFSNWHEPSLSAPAGTTLTLQALMLVLIWLPPVYYFWSRREHSYIWLHQGQISYNSLTNIEVHFYQINAPCALSLDGVFS